MRSDTVKIVDSGENVNPKGVHAAVEAALGDEDFGQTVVDGRMFWTVSGDEIHTYFRTNA